MHDIVTRTSVCIFVILVCRNWLENKNVLNGVEHSLLITADFPCSQKHLKYHKTGRNFLHYQQMCSQTCILFILHSLLCHSLSKLGSLLKHKSENTPLLLNSDNNGNVLFLQFYNLLHSLTTTYWWYHSNCVPFVYNNVYVFIQCQVLFVQWQNKIVSKYFKTEIRKWYMHKTSYKGRNVVTVE